MRVFTPEPRRNLDREVMFPTQRGDSLVHRLLRAGEPYLLTEDAALKFEELIRNGIIEGSMIEAEPRPLTVDTERALVFFLGEVGDAVCAGSSLPSAFCAHAEPTAIGFVTANADWSLFPFSRSAIFEYPITLRQAESYDAWIEYDSRAKPDQELPETFASAVGLKATEPVWTMPIPSLQEAVSHIPAETGRPKIGVSMYCGSHYRSWQAAHACIVMAGLIEAGFDCYIVGNAARRLRFKKDGEEQRKWGDGMYDASGLFPTVEEQVAFLSWMDGVIAPDGGTLQIACALGKPTLGLFGPTRGECRSKYASTLRWLNAEKDCSPCWCVGGRPPCEAKWCEAITDMEPEAIANLGKTMLEGRTDA